MSNARKLADNLPTEGQLGNRNIVINGGQTVDQRQSGSAITLTSSHQYATDRFICRLGTSSSSTAQQVADAPDGFYNSLKITIGTGASPSASTGTGYFAYKAEGLDVRHLKFGSSAAQTVTISFYVKSSLTGTFGITLGNSGLNRTFPSSYTINSANTWERKSITITGDTSGTYNTNTSAGFYLLWDLGNGSNYKGTANTWAGSDYRGGATGTASICATSGATWQITGIQLEVGPQSTPFEHEPAGVTLNKCQRYYWQAVGSGPHYYANQYSSGYRFIQVDFGQEMRATPTVTVSYAAGASLTNYIINRQHWKAYIAANYDVTTSYRSDVLKLDAEL